MLKKAIIAGVFSIGLILSGCGQTGDQPAVGKGKLNAEQVLSEVEKASGKLKNYEMTAKMDMEMEANGQTMKMPSTITSQIQLDPLHVHQKMNTENNGTPINLEMYVAKDEIYVNSQNQWVKMKNEGTTELIKATENMNPSKKIEQMKKFAKDLSLNEDKDNYEIKFSGKGDSVKDFAKEMITENLEAKQAEALKQQFDKMKINEISFGYTIDKKTFYPTKVSLDLNMDIGENGQTAKMKMKMDSTSSKFNELKDLSIPDDVKKNAKEVSPNNVAG
ncbi:DUF6612 family protein [Aneurinibacillus aneurinilyticus]|uniref:DUF6612 family protein n=1 Tax=Aneurinibacillus aneurinilyticus TaxID=1391 RepID=UPI003523330C